MGEWNFPPDEGKMESTDGIYFQTMTRREVEERLKKNDLIIIPVGASENHGAASPYGEDTFLVTRMAEQIAEATGCTVAEPIWYGSHPSHHIGMPGTIPVPEEDLVSYLRAIEAGFWNAGFRKQIFLNGHAQDYVISSAIQQFSKKYQVPAILVNVAWWFIIPEHLRDKEHGGPFETPFIHADECETSYSQALFPEMIDMEHAEKSEPKDIFPEGHIGKSGGAYDNPIPFWHQVGGSSLEVQSNPEGVVGDATLADPEKAEPGLNEIMDYIEKLINDIMEMYPAGELPPIEDMTMRDKEEIEEVLKGPKEGGKHIYTLDYPT